MTALRKQNQILNPQAGHLSLRAKGRLPFPVVRPESADTPNNSETLRQIAIKATAAGGSSAYRAVETLSRIPRIGERLCNDLHCADMNTSDRVKGLPHSSFWHQPCLERRFQAAITAASFSAEMESRKSNDPLDRLSQCTTTSKAVSVNDLDCQPTE